ncbi:MAG TPA: hypothetical protein PLF29_02620, partial [bacterium]|nr:hypothetical protein [bacterium]
MKARVFALLVIYYQKIRNNTSSRLVQFVILNLVLTLYNVIAPILKLDQINERVPLFYYMPWGNLQLVPKNYIFLVPSINLVLIGTGVLLYFVAKKYQFQYLDMLSIFTSSISNVLLTLSLYRSIYISSTPESISAGSAAIQFISPFFIALGLAYLLTPKFISVLTERGVVTNPLLHRHPGMLLAKPSARGGGFIFYLVFLAVSVVTVGFTKELTGIYLVAGILATLGLLDDFQNTNAKSRLKFIENPVLRLALLYITSYLFILFGISIKYIGNPAGGIFDFNSFSIVINNTPVFFLSVTITLLWVVWVLNLLSWSNGI